MVTSKEIEKFEKFAKQAAKRYYKKNIVGKNFDTILYNVYQEVLLDLGRLLAKLQIRKYCLSIMQKDTNFIKLQNSKSQKNLQSIILDLDKISNTLEEIINPILYGINK